MYPVQPPEVDCTLDLFSEDDWGATGVYQRSERWPEVAIIVLSAPLTSVGERLARNACCPHWAVRGPSSKFEGMCPACDPRKPVTVGGLFDIIAANLQD